MKGPDVKAHNTATISEKLMNIRSDTDDGAQNTLEPNPHQIESLGSLRRQTLVLLRWAAITGQTIALIVVALLLGFTYPYVACTLIILMAVVVNIVVSLKLPLDRRVSNFEAYLQLGFDLLQLTSLLWLTGGILNPFSLLFLAPVVTASTTLSRWVVLALGIMAMALSLGLVFFHQPLPWSTVGGFDLPLIMKFGFWTAIFIGTCFTSFYAWRSTQENRKMAFALTTAEAMLAHEQKLSALGGLAAAAAHELGTPLATIQVVAKEMTRDIKDNPSLSEDANLILSQAQRCRDILEQLSRRGDQGDLIHDVLSVEDLLEEAAEPFIGRGRGIIITCSGDGPEPIMKRRPELLYALKNYIDNAVGFAETRVELSAHWDSKYITFLVEDNGPGFTPAIKNRLGQPYATTRQNAKTAGSAMEFYDE